MNPTDDDLKTLVVPMYGASNLDQRIDDMTLVRDERDHLNTRPAPRVPRQTEPAPLWWVLAVGTAVLGGVAVLRFGSVCSGIEAASVAFEPLGWSAAWLAEIEPFPSAVLAHHYPDVLNLGDMTAIPRRVLAGEIEAPDMLCGGTPCQAFSVAGLRESLSDERGNLTLKFVEIADAIDHVRARRGAPPCNRPLGKRPWCPLDARQRLRVLFGWACRRR